MFIIRVILSSAALGIAIALQKAALEPNTTTRWELAAAGGIVALLAIAWREK